MKVHSTVFDEHSVLHNLKHYLPAQAPLKDFIHHNTLHAFQNLKFSDGIRKANQMFGYKVSLPLNEFRTLYKIGRINDEVLERIIISKKGSQNLIEWKEKILNHAYTVENSPRIGQLRSHWKTDYRIDLDSTIYPLLFRILCSYLDQGISVWNFPVNKKSFLPSIREMEKTSYSSFFKTSRARNMFIKSRVEIEDLLKILVGDETLYAQYLYDQQFSHQGWSGMVSVIEDQPETLLDHKKISLHELILFELFLEIDTLDHKFGEGNWKPLQSKLKLKPVDLFEEVPETELSQVLSIFQEAYEWSYYDQVLDGIQLKKPVDTSKSSKNFQAMFCIDDRECSLRRYLEKTDVNCETFGTPGFFGVEFYFKPENGKFNTKLCPAPVTPKYLIKEVGAKEKRKKEAHFTKKSHSLFQGWLISQTLGFWSAIKLFANIFRPTMSPATASSFRHMDKHAQLTIENNNPEHKENDLQIGFTTEEMATRVEALLRSIGLIENFAPIVYVIGHGASSVNNPYYAAYDCGACCGRPGSVNARVICFMANHPKVREILASHGIHIPESTQFIGGIHDTTRDDVAFYDTYSLNKTNVEKHMANEKIFEIALDLNAKERSRRFESIDTKNDAKKIHEKVQRRSVSLFEPRPEYNHATNSLCIVGRRDLTKKLFLDRRSFLNSYDYKIDPKGELLFNIIKPLGPVCGGINLEYFFSRVDNYKMGAGTKLPHNVMGLFGVANGIDGDLRPGLPSQMIEVHDPVRLLIIVEHFPQVVLDTIQKNKDVYEWFINEWVHLIAVNPETQKFSVFKDGNFTDYIPTKQVVDLVDDITPLLESQTENIPVYAIN